MSKTELLKESKARVRKMNFNDPVTNICAGESNPHRLGYFVRDKGRYVECTNGKKEFWEVGCEVVFAGHIGYSECEELFIPIHKILYS